MEHALNVCHTIPKAGPEMRVHRVEGKKIETLTVYSPSVFGLWTHWNGLHSEPCFGTNGNCHGHECGHPLRWKGYVHAFHHDRNEAVFLELTPMSSEKLIAQIDPGKTLRGVKINCKRAGEKKTTGLVVTVVARLENVSGLPEALDPIETLTRLWEMGNAVANRKLNR